MARRIAAAIWRLPFGFVGLAVLATSLVLLAVYLFHMGEMRGMRFWAQGAPAIGMALGVLEAARRPDQRALGVVAFLLGVLVVIGWAVAGALYGIAVSPEPLAGPATQ